MKRPSFILIIILFWSCSETFEQNPKVYFEHVNQAELAICKGDYEVSVKEYEKAFRQLKTPFGKDVFNAALSCQFIKDSVKRNRFLQHLIDHSDEWYFIHTTFVDAYMSEEDWENLLSKRNIRYNRDLRLEMREINQRDQLFRPDYENYDDTINAIRKLNLKRIIALAESDGYPSQDELGYTTYLRDQPQDIVLHHTAQRRSRDKTVLDLEPILKHAVQNGRFDPEQAIQYLNFQNDQEKGKFEVYSAWQFQHALLPDSLNSKVWFPNLTEAELAEVNQIRKAWYANSIDEIKLKADFLATSELPFIFSSVNKSFANLPANMDKETALEQYWGFVEFMLEKQKPALN